MQLCVLARQRCEFFTLREVVHVYISLLRTTRVLEMLQGWALDFELLHLADEQPSSLFLDGFSSF